MADSNTRVFHLHEEIVVAVTCQNIYVAYIRKFERIFYQVDENLDESATVAKQTLRKLTRAFHKLIVVDFETDLKTFSLCLDFEYIDDE